MAAVDARSVRARTQASALADFSVLGHKHLFSGASHLIGVSVVREIRHPFYKSMVSR